MIVFESVRAFVISTFAGRSNELGLVAIAVVSAIAGADGLSNAISAINEKSSKTGITAQLSEDGKSVVFRQVEKPIRTNYKSYKIESWEDASGNPHIATTNIGFTNAEIVKVVCDGLLAKLNASKEVEYK